MYDFYCAGPLFSVAEQDFNLKVCKLLEDAGYKVFLPQRDCPPVDEVTGTRPIFEACKRGIEASKVILAILDGADHDSGTSWEVGYAYGLSESTGTKKTILGFRTDFRQSGDTGGFNAMLRHSITLINIRDWKDWERNLIEEIKYHTSKGSDYAVVPKYDEFNNAAYGVFYYQTSRIISWHDTEDNAKKKIAELEQKDNLDEH